MLSLALAGVTWAQAASEPVDLNFGQFFEQPIGPRGLSLSPALRAAHGQRVRLQGFMVTQETPVPGRFLLTPRPVSMSEHADGDADDLPASTVTVLLPEGQQDRRVISQSGPLTLVGQLQVGRALDAEGHVSWVRLQLEPGALARQPTAPAPASH